MKKNRKKWLLRGGIVLAVIAIIIGGVLLKQKQEAKELERQLENKRQAEISAIYKKQNTYLHIKRDRAEYLPYDNHHINYLLTDLLCYEIETGNVLTYEDIIEYLDSEYEPDGSLRLYNNGNWPEIEAYIDWRSLPEKEKSCETISYRLISLQVDWSDQYPELIEPSYSQISLHNIQELIALYKDESYEPKFIFD